MIQKLFLFVLSTFFKFLPNKKQLLYTFLFIALGLVNGYGQTNTWTGTTSTAWDTATNWSLNLVPTTAHDVVIPNVTNKPTILVAGAVCNTLSINNILGGSTNTLTITSPGTLVVTGAITMTASTTGAINTTIAVETGSLTAASVTMNDSGNDNIDCILSLSTGTINISGNITMSGSTARNQVTFLGAGTLNIGGTMTGGGLTRSTGTVNYNNSGAQTIGAYAYNNLTLSGSGTKTFGAITTVSGNWSMISGTLANLGGFTHTAGTLVLGGAGPLLSSWGSTTSGATNTTNNYFTGTGRINVSSAPYPAIDNNYASYTSGVTGQVAGTQGEYSNPPTNTLPGSLTLSAPAGSAFINVKFASYGSPGGTSPNFTIGSCHAFNSRTVTTGLLGQNIATIPASGSFNATFGDPCYGIVKSYNVVATYAEPFCTTSGVSSFVINGSTPTGGNGTYTYLWEKSTTGHSTGYAAASGTNNAKDYTVPAGTSQTTWYRRTVTSGIYSDATIVIVQVVTGPPTVPTTFTSVTSCAGTTTLSVSGGSLGGLGGYVEFSSGSCGGTVVGTSNSIPATLVVSPTVGNTTYYVRYRNACGNTTCLSTVATNTVSIAAAASATAVCFSAASQNASLAYTATAGTPNKYSIVWDTAAITAGLINQTDTSFAFVATGGTLNTIAIPANVPAGTYTGILTVKNNSGCVSFKNNFTVTVNPIPTVTNSPLTQTICSGGSSTLVTLTSGVAGTTFAWTASATAGVSGFTASGTSMIPVQTISTTGTTQGTVTYVITPTANGCPGTATNYTVLVNPILSVPTVSTITNISCITNTGSVVLNDLPSGSWTINQSGTAITSYSSNTSSYTVLGLSAGSYTFTVTNASGCPSSATAAVPITDGSSTTWNGTVWSNGTPDATKNAIIASVTPNSPFTADLSACAMTINSGVVATVPSGVTLTITNGITVSTDYNLIFENNASLVQTNNVINTGSIIYKRNSAPMKNFDYTYWSSPVAGQTLFDLSPNTLADKYMSYSGTGWQISYGGTAVMQPGIGYIIRTPKGGTWPAPHPEVVAFPYSQPVQFKGVPNNGDITSSQSMVTGNFYLIGNPYPSALDADEFLFTNTNNNTVLNGTIYLWTHNTAVTSLKYTSDDYASYNGLGGVATSGGAVPSGYIAAGQSFFASAKANGNAAFDNSMRPTGNNTQFFKPGKTAKTAGLEKHRLWLNMTNSGGAFKQTLIGYVEGATNSFDDDFDGLTFDGNSYLDLYSINGTDNLTIQGRALPFVDTDVVPLGYRSTVAGSFTIAINQADGALATQRIYLKDKQTGTINELTAQNYTFSTAIGTFNNRFVLRYTNTTLGTGDFETVENSITIVSQDKTITISSPTENLSKVFIYDVSGKQLYKKQNVGNVQLSIQHLPFAQQVLLVKVVLENGYTTTKKLIFK